MLPGSRRPVIRRMMAICAAIALVENKLGALDVVLPTLPHVEDLIRKLADGWPIKPRIVLGEAQKFAEFRAARAALAASGTVALELALAGCPFVGA